MESAPEPTGVNAIPRPTNNNNNNANTSTLITNMNNTISIQSKTYLKALNDLITPQISEILNADFNESLFATIDDCNK